MNKYHFIFDKIEQNKKLINFILKKYTNYSPLLSNVIVVLGGDGFMLKVLKKPYKQHVEINNYQTTLSFTKKPYKTFCGT